MDRKTEKIMTMKIMYHPQSDTDRLYISRMEGGRELLSIVDCAETEEQFFFSIFRSVGGKIIEIL